MSKASDLKKGAAVNINDIPHILEDLTISTPTARGGNSLYRMRFRNLVTKNKVDKTFKGDDDIADATFERRKIQFSYEDRGTWVFSDNEDFTEYSVFEEDMEENKLYISEDTEGLTALVTDGVVLAIELPPVTDLEITETGPSIKGASATSRTKPATLSTGLIVQVPEYMENGAMVRVDTTTGKFLSRA